MITPFQNHTFHQHVSFTGTDLSWMVEFLKGMVKPVAATAVVLLAVLLSFMQKLGLEGEMVYAMFRAFLQLSIIGFVLQFIFNQGNAGWIILAYLFMVTLLSYPFIFQCFTDIWIPHDFKHSINIFLFSLSLFFLLHHIIYDINIFLSFLYLTRCWIALWVLIYLFPLNPILILTLFPKQSRAYIVEMECPLFVGTWFLVVKPMESEHSFQFHFCADNNFQNWRISIIPSVGVCCWLHCRSTCETCPSWEICCWSFHSDRNCSDHVPSSVTKRVPFHPQIHHSSSRHDGRKCHDSNRCHHEKTPRRHQSTNELSKPHKLVSKELLLPPFGLSESLWF